MRGLDRRFGYSLYTKLQAPSPEWFERAICAYAVPETGTHGGWPKRRSWLNWGFEVLSGRAHEAFRQHVLELAAPRSGDCLLDAGCGTGMMALCIAARSPGCKVHGIHLSPKMIATARRDTEMQGLAVDFRVGSITRLPHPGEEAAGKASGLPHSRQGSRSNL